MVEDNDITEPSDIADVVAECDSDSGEMPEEMDHNKNVEQVDRSACRDVTTGRFTKGWKGGGRPQGSRDRFSKRVLDTLEACWEANADEMLTQLASEKPEVIMGMISRLMPQAVITEDLTGEKEVEANQQPITIRLINQAQDSALPHHDEPRLVEGEVMPEETTH